MKGKKNQPAPGKEPTVKPTTKQPEAAKEQPKEAPKEAAPKEQPKEAATKEQPKEAATKDQPKENANKEQPKENATKEKTKEGTVKGQGKQPQKKDKKEPNKNEPKTNRSNQKDSKDPKNTQRGNAKKTVRVEKEKELFTSFGKRIINIKQEDQDLDTNTFLKYNVIGVLFTGSWVPPAKEFMTQLEGLYKEVNEQEKVFEIVQVSSEKTVKDFNDNLKEERNWLYVPFNDAFIPKLVEQFKVEYLPKLVVVNREMFVLSETGRKDMTELGNKAYEKWYKAYRNRKEELQKEKEEKEEHSEGNDLGDEEN